jgi:hypothetical protein
VRINPYELHVIDPEFYDVLYSGTTSKRDKYLWATMMFGNAPSMLGTVHHDHHRLRRGALNKFFSKRSVMSLEPMIRDMIEKMCGRMRKARETGELINLGHMYAALTMDIITQYSYANSYGCLDADDFMHVWPDTIDAVSEGSHLNKQCPWMLPIFQAMPPWMVAAIDANFGRLIAFQMVRCS